MFLALNEAILDARAHHFIFLHALKEPSDIIILGLELVIIFASRLILILNLFFLESSTEFIPFLKHVVRLTINVYMKWLKQYEKEALFYFSDNDHYLHHFQYDSFFFFYELKLIPVSVVVGFGAFRYQAPNVPTLFSIFT